MKYLLAFCLCGFSLLSLAQQADTLWTPWPTYPEQPAPPEELILIVDSGASFPGGYGAMFDYIRKNLSYPQPAYYRRVQGTVLIRVLIGEQGKLEEIDLRQGLGYGCDEEALRLVKRMPDWQPAQYQGCPVRRRLIIPITFELPSLTQSAQYSSGRPY